MPEPLSHGTFSGGYGCDHVRADQTASGNAIVITRLRADRGFRPGNCLTSALVVLMEKRARMTSGPKSPDPSVAEIFGNVELRLSRFLLRFLDRPEDVQDIMQDAYIRVQNASKGTKFRSTEAFIFKTAKNLALNERARHRNRMTNVVDFDEFSASIGGAAGNGPEFEAIVSQELARAIASFGELSPRVRDTYILRKVHGLSQKETARRLGISQSTVEKHVAKGLVILARKKSDE